MNNIYGIKYYVMLLGQVTGSIEEQVVTRNVAFHSCSPYDSELLWLKLSASEERIL